MTTPLISKATPQPIKVLLVDDTPENLVALEALVRRDGVQVLTARTGAEALELLLVHEVALALLDVQMPEMDGLQATRVIRQHERAMQAPPIPIIGMTAHALDSARERCLDAGMDDYIAKPFTPADLERKIRRLMRREAASPAK